MASLNSLSIFCVLTLSIAVGFLIVLMGIFEETPSKLWTKVSTGVRKIQAARMAVYSENVKRQTVLTAGPMELAQLEYFLGECNKTCQPEQNKAKGVFCRRHKVEARIREDGYPVVTIQEFDSNECGAKEPVLSPSKGGSNFRIEIYGNNYRILCAPIDYLNGTYTAVCPKIYSCETGTVFWDYAHFEAYRHHIGSKEKIWWPERIHKNIGSFHICSNETMPSLRENAPECRNKSIEKYLRGRWWKGIDSSIKRRWGTEDGCLLPLLTKKELEKCFIDSGKEVHFFGDSHVRNTHALLRRELDATLLAKVKYPPSTRISIVSAVYAHQIMHSIKYTISNSTKFFTSKKILMINFGIWDLIFKTAENLIKEFPSFINFIKELRNNPKTAHVRIIYANVFPRFNGDQDTNYYMIPAINEMFRPGLESLGVEVIDGFNIFNPVMDTTCDTVHFVCGPRASYTGNIFSHLLFRIICKDVI